MTRTLSLLLYADIRDEVAVLLRKFLCVALFVALASIGWAILVQFNFSPSWQLVRRLQITGINSTAQLGCSELEYSLWIAQKEKDDSFKISELTFLKDADFDTFTKTLGQVHGSQARIYSNFLLVEQEGAISSFKLPSVKLISRLTVPTEYIPALRAFFTSDPLLPPIHDTSNNLVNRIIFLSDKGELSLSEPIRGRRLMSPAFGSTGLISSRIAPDDTGENSITLVSSEDEQNYKIPGDLFPYRFNIKDGKLYIICFDWQKAFTYFVSFDLRSKLLQCNKCIFGSIADIEIIDDGFIAVAMNGDSYSVSLMKMNHGDLDFKVIATLLLPSQPIRHGPYYAKEHISVEQYREPSWLFRSKRYLGIPQKKLCPHISIVNLKTGGILSSEACGLINLTQVIPFSEKDVLILDQNGNMELFSAAN